MTTHHTLSDDARAKRTVIILVLAQAIVGAQMPLFFTIGGRVGQQLASNPCFATLPISMVVLSSMLMANPMSWTMQKYGRRAGFWLGTAGGVLGGGIGAYAVSQSSFALLLVGAFFIGFYMSAQGFFRFAAADTASDEFRPKAISYVMAGGLVSAIIGPQLSSLTETAMVVVFFGSFLAIIALNLSASFHTCRMAVPAMKARGWGRIIFMGSAHSLTASTRWIACG